MLLSVVAQAQVLAPPKYTAQDLKTNGLIICLPDYKKRIDYLRLNSRPKTAAKEQAKIARNNREIVRFFKAHFTFCQVNFYYTSLEEDLKNGLPVLLDAQMNIDESIPMPKKVIIGRFYFREDQANMPFPKRTFWVEHSDITIKLPSESWRPFWKKKLGPERDVIRINQKLPRMPLGNGG